MLAIAQTATTGTEVIFLATIAVAKVNGCSFFTSSNY